MIGIVRVVSEEEGLKESRLPGRGGRGNLGGGFRVRIELVVEGAGEGGGEGARIVAMGRSSLFVHELGRDCSVLDL